MNKFLHFFEKYGVVKIFASFLLIALFVWLGKNTHNVIYNYLLLVPVVYLILAFLLFFGAGIINSIKDKC